MQRLQLWAGIQPGSHQVAPWSSSALAIPFKSPTAWNSSYTEASKVASWQMHLYTATHDTHLLQIVVCIKKFVRTELLGSHWQGLLKRGFYVLADGSKCDYRGALPCPLVQPELAQQRRQGFERALPARASTPRAARASTPRAVAAEAREQPIDFSTFDLFQDSAGPAPAGLPDVPSQLFFDADLTAEAVSNLPDFVSQVLDEAAGEDDEDSDLLLDIDEADFDLLS